jgi:hypothetical protein
MLDALPPQCFYPLFGKAFDVFDHGGGLAAFRRLGTRFYATDMISFDRRPQVARWADADHYTPDHLRPRGSLREPAGQGNLGVALRLELDRDIQVLCPMNRGGGGARSRDSARRLTLSAFRRPTLTPPLAL